MQARRGKDCTSNLFEKVIELEKELFKFNTVYMAKQTNMDQLTHKATLCECL